MHIFSNKKLLCLIFSRIVTNDSKDKSQWDQMLITHRQQVKMINHILFSKDNTDQSNR